MRVDRLTAAWHIDYTIIKLLDGSKAYVHAVIDNLSRRILVWPVDAKLALASTGRLFGHLTPQTEGSMAGDALEVRIGA